VISRIEFVSYNLNNMAQMFDRRSMSRLLQKDQRTPEKKLLTESTYQIKQMEDFSKFKMGSLEIERQILSKQ
jgi:hypothetical protein